MRTRRHRQAGFTVLELVVVMVVMAVVTVTVVIGIGNIRGASVDSEAGQLAVAVRHLYTMSVLHGRSYRLVLDLDTHAWWGEAQDSRDPCKAYLLPGEGEEEGDDKGTAPQVSDEDEETGAPPPASFGDAKSVLLQKHQLPKGVALVTAMASHLRDPATRGQAMIHFFPNGTVEAGFVVVADEDDAEDAMTVEVMPLQGTARVSDGALAVEDWLDPERAP